MWDLPGPGLEPVSPALAGRFLTTAPPGKSLYLVFVVVGHPMELPWYLSEKMGASGDFVLMSFPSLAI